MLLGHQRRRHHPVGGVSGGGAAVFGFGMVASRRRRRHIRGGYDAVSFWSWPLCSFTTSHQPTGIQPRVTTSTP
jgi:MYXO-CTERM domain-containing protein